MDDILNHVTLTVGAVPEPYSGPVFRKWIALVILNNSISEGFAQSGVSPAPEAPAILKRVTLRLSMENIVERMTLMAGSNGIAEGMSDTVYIYKPYLLDYTKGARVDWINHYNQNSFLKMTVTALVFVFSIMAFTQNTGTNLFPMNLTSTAWRMSRYSDVGRAGQMSQHSRYDDVGWTGKTIRCTLSTERVNVAVENRIVEHAEPLHQIHGDHVFEDTETLIVHPRVCLPDVTICRDQCVMSDRQQSATQCRRVARKTSAAALGWLWEASSKCVGVGSGGNDVMMSHRRGFSDLGQPPKPAKKLMVCHATATTSKFMKIFVRTFQG
ncbi:hypothetical protein B0H13DRAFT_1862081 [Mycena leptocephala]|nr:hypothetical protein B0H13DRAFT_1862081 [Mycena leptocephala]